MDKWFQYGAADLYIFVAYTSLRQVYRGSWRRLYTWRVRSSDETSRRASFVLKWQDCRTRAGTAKCAQPRKLVLFMKKYVYSLRGFEKMMARDNRLVSLDAVQCSEAFFSLALLSCPSMNAHDTPSLILADSMRFIFSIERSSRKRKSATWRKGTIPSDI